MHHVWPVSCFEIHCIKQDKTRAEERSMSVLGVFFADFSQLQSLGVRIIRTPTLFDNIANSFSFFLKIRLF